MKTTKKIKVGDTVKVINSTLVNGHAVQLIPIGTICRVASVENNIIGLIPIFRTAYKEPFYYLDDEVEKGELIWLPANHE